MLQFIITSVPRDPERFAVGELGGKILTAPLVGSFECREVPVEAAETLSHQDVGTVTDLVCANYEFM